MHKSKLITLLNSFTAKEMKSFAAFLTSPYHNTNEEITRFFEHIKKYIADLVSTQLSKKKVFSTLFPGKVYDDKQMRYLMSGLLKLGEQFIVIQRIKSKDLERSLLLLDEFSSKKLDKHYYQLKTKIEPQFTKNKLNNSNPFLLQLTFTHIEEKYQGQKQEQIEQSRLQEKSVFLNYFYMLHKLKYACSMLNRSFFLRETYDIDLPKDWLFWLKKNNYWDDTTIKMYASTFLVLEYPDEPGYFDDLINLLQTEAGKVSNKELKELFLYAINYCARKTREGNSYFVEKALTLYLEGIKTGALLEDGYFSSRSFNNVVKLALRLEKYNWIEDFIEQYKHFLPVDSQENILQYNLAELNCYKKEFNKALGLLSQVEFSDLGYQIGSRIMLCKIYYELKEEKALLSLISSFMMFLKRNKKISDPIRKTCLNFCDILFFIMRNKINGIEERIATTTLLTDRDWLLEKISQIKRTVSKKNEVVPPQHYLSPNQIKPKF